MLDGIDMTENPEGLTTTLSKSGDTIIADISGDKITAETIQDMLEILLNLGITTSDLRFATGDHALTVGQVVEIRCALRS
jgi:hypothetical protein